MVNSEEKEALDENLRLRNEDHPERQIVDFFTELEALQEQEMTSTGPSEPLRGR